MSDKEISAGEAVMMVINATARAPARPRRPRTSRN